MQPYCDLLGESTQGDIEPNGEAASRLAIEERAFGNASLQHFLQAERLGAQLDLVRPVCPLGATSLVFDREGHEPTRSPRQLHAQISLGPVYSMELHHVGPPRESQAETPQAKTTGDAHVTAELAPPGIGRPMQA
jgi:hypothetical protein